MMQKRALSSIQFIVLWALLFAGAVGLLIAVTDVASWLPAFLFVFSILLTAAPFFAVFIFRGQRFDLFAPIYIFSVTLLFHLILPALDYFSSAAGYPPDLLSKALALVIAFTILFYFGYYFIFNRSENADSAKRADTDEQTPAERYSTSFIVVGIVALVAVSLFAEWRMLNAISGFSSLMLLMRSRLDMFDYISGVTLSMIRLARPAFFLALFLVFRDPGKTPFRYVLLAVVTGIIAIAVGVFTGNRGDFISPLLTLIILYHYCRRRIPIFYAVILLPIAILFLSLYLFYVRSPYLRAATMGMSLTNQAGYLLSDLFGSGTFMEIRSVMDVIRGVPDILPYQWGKTYLALTTSFIPRSIFPNKLPEASEVFNLAFYPERWFSGGGHARVSMLGELYMNFGLLGILGGAVLLGMLMRQVYQTLIHKQQKVLFYALILPTFYFLLRGNFVGVMVRFLVDFVPVWGVLTIASYYAKGKASERIKRSTFSVPILDP